MNVKCICVDTKSGLRLSSKGVDDDKKSFNYRNNIQADNYDPQLDSIYPFPTNRDIALNGKIGLDYNISDNQDIRISLARKTRFGTMKDRYSYRLGRSIPNPELTSESAFHIDLILQISWRCGFNSLHRCFKLLFILKVDYTIIIRKQLPHQDIAKGPGLQRPGTE